MANEKYLGIVGCKGCLKCVDVCPVKALVSKNGYVSIDQEKCTLCRKCIEVCQYDAIVCLD